MVLSPLDIGESGEAARVESRRGRAYRGYADVTFALQFCETQLFAPMLARTEHKGHDTMRVLIVDDDRQISEWQRRILAEAGFQATIAYTGADAQQLALNGDYDLALIDLGLPDMPGLSLVSAMRSSGLTLPIIIVSGRSAESATIAGLDAGADDFITKPATAALLLARVRAALRRGGATLATEMRIGDLRLNRLSHLVHVRGHEIALTRKEYDLLALLAARAEQMVPRSELLKRVWGFAFSPGTNVLEATMSRLRAKISAHTAHPQIRTFRNTGYMLTNGVPESEHPAGTAPSE